MQRHLIGRPGVHANATGRLAALAGERTLDMNPSQALSHAPTEKNARVVRFDCLLPSADFWI